MSSRLLRVARVVAPLAAVLAGAGFTLPAHAGVSWSIGISAPLAPGVQIGTVIGGGHRHHRPPVAAYVPAPVVYAPPPVVYAPPPVVYAPPPGAYVPPLVYAPPVYAPPMVVAPRPIVYAPPVVVRPGYSTYRAPVIVRPGHGHGHGHWHDGGRPGSYPPVARVNDGRWR